MQCNINQPMEQDADQRELALDSTQSFIVQAPAGSGKTELLIQRYLTLLQYVKTPEEILAITFTKKAANEMRARVIIALKKAAFRTQDINPNSQKTINIAARVLQRDQLLGWNLLLNPNRLHIETIDALCVYLTKSLPLLSGFGSQPTITDFPQHLYTEAVRSVLHHLEDQHSDWSEDVANLLTHLDNDINKLHDLLINLLMKRDQWIQYIHLDVENDAIKQGLNKHLALVVHDRLTALKDCIPAALTSELLAVLKFAAQQGESIAKPFLDKLSLPNTTHQDLMLWQCIARFLLTKQLTWRKRVDKEIGFPALSSLKNAIEKSMHQEYRERYQHLITKLQEQSTSLLLLKEILLLPKTTYNSEQWRTLLSLFNILKLVVAELRIIFQQSGQIDFIENAQAALLALGGDEKPTDLLLALDYTIQHILIDEFQDTSTTQYQLLEKLIAGFEPNDGRTLFVVGDPMQSIYRFREAEVGLFIRMRKHGIGNVALTPLTLTANFRSLKDIVDWNNQHFQAIFPTVDDIGRGAVSFSASYAKKNEMQAKISINSFQADTENDQQQAKSILNCIIQHQAQYPEDTIAILVRSRSHLATIIPTLNKANISFHAIDIDPLAERPHIQDLLQLTLGMLHLANTIAWLSILRAPWCGLTLNDLWIITEGNHHNLIWQQLLKHDVNSRLSEDGKTRLNRLISVMKTQLDNRHREDLRTWIESTWQLLGGPATLNNEMEIQDAHAYFEFLTNLEQDDLNINIDILKDKVASFYASSNQDEHCKLQMMTIHSAKGLEFDMVILPHLERKLPMDDKALLNWIEWPLNISSSDYASNNHDKAALLISAINPSDEDKDPLYEYIHYQKKLKSEYETDRLFYVATTRAKKYLHLFYNLSLDASGDAIISANSFLSKLWPFIKSDIVMPEKAAMELAKSDEPTKYEREQHRILKRLSSSWQTIIQQDKQKIFYHQQQSGFKLQDHLPKIIGIVVHRTIHNIAKFGLAWWTNKNHQQQWMHLQQLFNQIGVLPANINNALSKAHTMIKNCCEDERGKWILQPHQDAHSEFAISTIIDNEVKHFVIDRTFIDNDQIRWIIDFKTSTTTDEELESFLQNEYDTYREKMQLYYRAFKQQTQNSNLPIQLALYFPAIPAWKAWSSHLN